MRHFNFNASQLSFEKEETRAVFSHAALFTKMDTCHRMTKCKVNLKKKYGNIGRWFGCGSLLPVFGVRVSVTFRLTCVNIFLVRFRLLSGHLFWEIAAHSVDHMFSFVF